MSSRIHIKGDSLIYHHVTKLTITIFLMVMIFSIGLGYLFAIPLINNSFPDFPRSFFMILSGTGWLLGFLTLKSFLNYRTKTIITPKSQSVLEERSVFGVQKEQKNLLAKDAFITYIEFAHIQTNNTNEYACANARTVYELSLTNNKTKIPLYSGVEKEEADIVLGFCKQQNIIVNIGKKGANKLVFLGTAFFFIILLAELALTGKLQ